jgi:hypothetical protein
MNTRDLEDGLALLIIKNGEILINLGLINDSSNYFMSEKETVKHVNKTEIEKLIKNCSIGYEGIMNTLNYHLIFNRDALRTYFSQLRNISQIVRRLDENITTPWEISFLAYQGNDERLKDF